MRKKADVNVSVPELEEEQLNHEFPPVMENSDSTFSITLSRSLSKQLNNLSKYEGIHSHELVLELVAEGIARRIMEDQTRPAPSHLMTRNGYVQDQMNAQPSMSHHSFQANGNVRDVQNRGKNNFQRPQQRPQNNNPRYNNRNNQNSGYASGNNAYFKPPKKTEF